MIYAFDLAVRILRMRLYCYVTLHLRTQLVRSLLQKVVRGKILKTIKYCTDEIVRLIITLCTTVTSRFTKCYKKLRALKLQTTKNLDVFYLARSRTIGPR